MMFTFTQIYGFSKFSKIISLINLGYVQTKFEFIKKITVSRYNVFLVIYFVFLGPYMPLFLNKRYFCLFVSVLIELGFLTTSISFDNLYLLLFHLALFATAEILKPLVQLFVYFVFSIQGSFLWCKV